MTEVQKVSIGGYAFTLEVEAYNIVKQYLDELNEHYAPLEGGAEVMEGIEERMAELLYEKCADDGVASVAEVNEIIAVLGKPSAIESEEDPAPKHTETPGTKKPGGKKRLYRDPTNKMLGGVCSGLAAYFKIDVVIIRIIFLALTILSCVVGCHVESHGIKIGNWLDFDTFSVNAWAPLLYIILWIAMPEARTVQQRWELGVTNPPAGGQPAGSGLGRVLRVIIGCLLLLMGVAGMTFGVAALLGQKFFDWFIVKEGMEVLEDNVPGMLTLLGSKFYKLDVLLICFLPMVGMIYGGIMLLFDIKSPSWRPGLVIFLVWVIALVIFIVLTAMGFFSAEIWN